MILRVTLTLTRKSNFQFCMYVCSYLYTHTNTNNKRSARKQLEVEDTRVLLHALWAHRLGNHVALVWGLLRGVRNRGRKRVWGLGFAI